MYRNLHCIEIYSERHCGPTVNQSYIVHVCVVQRPPFHLWCWLSSSNFCSCDPETTERREKNRNRLMWIYITHHGSLRATYAVAAMLSGHTTVCEAFFGKVRHSFWNVYRNNRKGSVHCNAVGMTDCGLIRDESQSSQTVGCLGRVNQISNM